MAKASKEKIALAHKAVEEYTGKKVETIDVFQDPKVSGCIAIRVTLEGEKHHIDFIKTHSDPINADNLEEAEFTEWPPKSEGLKYF